MYSGRVLIGNWFDKLVLESEKRAKESELRAQGKLSHQLESRLLHNFLKPVIPNPNAIRISDNLEYNQPVLLQAPEIHDLSARLAKKTGCPLDDSIANDEIIDYGLVLAATVSFADFRAGVRKIEDGCGLACIGNRSLTARSVFRLVKPDGRRKFEGLGYGLEFYLELTNTDERLYLRSEPPLIDGRFGPNHHNPVMLSACKDSYAKWRALHWDRHKRFETEGSSIPLCARIVIQHVMTNQCLAVEHRNWHYSLLGFECGVSAHNYVDVHRNETSECIWSFVDGRIDR